MRDQIESLEWEWIETTLKEHKNEDALVKLEQFKRSNTKPFFLWKLNFSEVFQEKGGFDVVIANPPYVSHVNLTKIEKTSLIENFQTFKGRADIYVAFYEKGIKLLKQNGVLTFISSNKFLRAGYGDSLRRFLKNEIKIYSLIDFGDTPLFDAITYPCIVIIQNTKEEIYDFSFLLAKNINDLRMAEKFKLFNSNYLENEIWSFENKKLLKIWKKIHNKSIPLSTYICNNFYRGIVTGFNKAFVINEKQKDNFASKNPLSTQIIKSYLMGKDVKRWRAKANYYIIFAYHGIDINKYPEILEYLTPFRKKLERRATSKNHKWYELQQPQTGIYKHYEKTKIISTDIAKRCEFTLEYNHSFIDATIFCIPLDDLYLLSLLNSSLIESYYKSISSTIRGDFLRFKKIYLYKLPIKKISSSKQKPFIRLAQKTLSLTKANDYLDNAAKQAKVKEYEQQINEMVYELYGLTEDEIAIVEGKDES